MGYSTGHSSCFDVIRRFGGPTLATLFLAGGAAFLYRQRELLADTVRLQQHYLIPLLLAEALMLVARGLLTRELCLPFGVRLRFSEAVALASWTTLANYLAPMVGGAGMRAVYLKRRHGLPYSHFLSLHAKTYAVHFWVGGVAGLVALGFLAEVPAASRGLLAGLFAGAVAGCSLILFAPRRMRRLGVQGWLGVRGGRCLELVREGAELLSSRGSWNILWVLVLNLVAMSVSLFSAFALLGVALSPLEALLAASVTSYSVLLSLTPASFGITESVIVFAGSLAGVEAPLALAAAGIKRFLALAVTALTAAGAAATGHRIAGAGPTPAEPPDS